LDFYNFTTNQIQPDKTINREPIESVVMNKQPNKMHDQIQYGALFDDLPFYNRSQLESPLDPIDQTLQFDSVQPVPPTPQVFQPSFPFRRALQPQLLFGKSISIPLVRKKLPKETNKEPLNNQKKEQEEDSQPILQNTNSNLIQLVAGLTSSHGKVIGGRGNKESLPKQIIKLGDNLPPVYTPSKLVINAFLYGHKKGETKPTKIESLEVEKSLNESNGSWTATFEKIVLKHSSHHNGQKLFIRFYLFDSESKKTLYKVDSSTFETITKRGIEVSSNEKFNKI
jgi:hypothetical protein